MKLVVIIWVKNKTFVALKKFKPMDVFGNALLDYWNGIATENILTHSNLGDTDEIPLDYLFRDYKQMPALEKKALSLCKGTILDLGAGAGSHSLYLQKQQKSVTALDLSKGAAEVCKLRGLKTVICEDLFDHKLKYNTILLLMNGTGLAGTLKNLGPFLEQLKKLLNPNGCILVEGTDILYMFESDEEDGGYWIPDQVDYYGELRFTMQYKDQKTAEFPWLYLDYNTLARAAQYHGFETNLVLEGPQDNYLAKLSLS